MKVTPIVSLLAPLALASSLNAASFTVGNLVVSRVGDGTTALVNTGGPISLLEFTTGGALQQTISISTTTSTGLQLSGTATSEGALSLSQDGKVLSIAGYIPPFSGTGSLASRTDINAPRGYVTVGADGVVSAAVAIGAYSNNNIRSAAVSEAGVYFAGASSGTIYRDTSNTSIQSTVTNTRVVHIYNDNLFFSSASGQVRGVYGFTGTPTTSSTPTLLLNMGESAEPYDFVFNSSGTVSYVTNGNAIQRWTYDGTAWSLGQTSGIVGSGLTGLEVIFGDTSDSIYAVNPGSLYGLTFDGSSFSSASSLATAGSNYAFRGLAFAPIPEPTSALLGGLGLLVLLRRRR